MSKFQEAGSILRVNFALSKWSHFHRVYLVTVCKRKLVAVEPPFLKDFKHSSRLSSKLTSRPLTNHVSLVGGLDGSEVQLRFNQSPGFRNTFLSLPISGGLVGTSRKQIESPITFISLSPHHSQLMNAIRTPRISKQQNWYWMIVKAIVDMLQ